MLTTLAIRQSWRCASTPSFSFSFAVSRHKHLSTGQGRQQGKELLSLLHQKHDVPVEGPPGPPATPPPLGQKAFYFERRGRKGFDTATAALGAVESSCEP